jgi:hypothetical protein
VSEPAPTDAPAAPEAADAPETADAPEAAAGAPESAAPETAAASPAPAPAAPAAPAAPDIVDRFAAWLAAHGALPALGLVTVLVGALFSGVFRGEVVGDDLSFHMAEARRIADCIAAGDWDFWNPSANGGFASLYYYQAVPQLVSALPAALFGHFVFWFQLSVYLPHVLAPAAAYRGARLMGATPWQACAAAIAVAMISGESRWGTGADGTFQVGLYTQTWALAAFPLALGHGARWIASGRGLAPAIAWGAFVTLCHPFAGISLGLVLVVGVAAHVIVALAAALSARGLPVRAIAAAACFAGLALHVVLLLVRWQALYLVPAALLAALTARLGWELVTGYRPERPRPLPLLYGEVPRLAILGVAMLVAAMPVWLTVLVDYDGFGGFPHRVNDEVGPGYQELMRWQLRGAILDFRRPMVLTWLIPAVLLLARAQLLRWLWAPALVFAALLAVGPHMPKTADDLLPAVRFLGAMQVVLAMAVGVGVIAAGAKLWAAPDRSAARHALRIGLVGALAAACLLLLYTALLGGDGFRVLAVLGALALGKLGPLSLRVLAVVLAAATVVAARPLWRALGETSGARTALAAVLAALTVALVVPGSQALGGRVRVLGDFDYRAEVMELTDAIAREPQGRKQVGTGAENHWWNQLSYVYARRPALLQMGGGGLQASPNYDFMWSVRDLTKLAWVYDTPYLVFASGNESKQPAGETIRKTHGYELRRLAAPGLVSPIQITAILPPGRKDARKAAIDWLRTDEGLRNRHLVYAGHGLPSGPPDARVLRAGRTASPGDHADLFAEVDAARPSTFVFRESWHPRWHAYVDGMEAPVRRVTPDFPAVDVTAGKHLLQLRFERPWWAHAAWLAWPALPLLAWLALRRRERPADAAAPLPEARIASS